MAGEKGVEVEKSVSKLQKEIKADWKNLSVSLGKVFINTVSLQWKDALENSLEVLNALGLDAKPGEVAGLLIVRSLLLAMQKLQEGNRELFVKEPSNLKGLWNKLNDSLATSNIVINEDFFRHPRNLPILPEAQEAFRVWLEEFVEKPVQAEQISKRLPTYFLDALNEEWLKNSSQYQLITESLDTPFTKATQRQHRWLRYQASLERQVEEPMFLEAFGLRQVYVPLRGYYEEPECEEEEVAKEYQGKASGKVKRKVIQLQEELEAWLEAGDKDDAIRLLSGGPGSGKSSFTKMFAAQQAAKGEIPVLFIPLHLFKLSNDLIKAVEDFVKFHCFLQENPLDRDNEELRLLLIFDSLDELSKQGKLAEKTASDFVEEVRIRVGNFNYHKLRLQVVISGREVVVQANKTKFRSPRQLLYLLPYFVPENKRYKYDDEENLLATDQRQIWWNKYGSAKGKEYLGLPEELNKENLDDVTAQPLLNYLISLSLERDKLKFTQETNLNEIYADLLEGVYERGYEKHGYRPTEGIEKDQFVGILEEIALACWHGDGRTTTVREIEKHCDDSGSREILDNFQASFQEDSKASITRLLTAFYFRESGGVRDREKTFEFTHKSFGEYLTATRIIDELDIICEGLKEKRPRKGLNKRDALIKWAKLCGPTEISSYLFNFILDEMRLRDIEDVCLWQQTLCRLIEFMLRNGMPMEEVTPRSPYQEKVQQAANSEGALLVVLNACARVTEKISDIDWSNYQAFEKCLLTLRRSERSYLPYLSFLKLDNCFAYDMFFHEANFQEAQISNSHMVPGNFIEANFAKANLSHSQFNGSSMQLADFTEANLFRINFASFGWSGASESLIQHSNLEEVIFHKANIQNSLFNKANLKKADFTKAKLKEVNFSQANLKGANFTSAKFEDVSFEGANLEWAIFDNTIYEGVDIETLTKPANK